MKITNTGDVCLPLAVWLLHDEYDYVDAENYISVTGLMKPIRQILLPSRVPPEKQVNDVQDFIASRLGHAIHDSIERSWVKGAHRSLKLLGYPDKVIERIKINPTPEEIRASNSIIPIYLEQRAQKQINGFTIGGKFDMVADGILHDFKSTSVHTWIKGTRDEEHQLQGSLYRWLHPDKIHSDYIRVAYIFTDWSKNQAVQPGYPSKRVEHKDIPLLSLAETERWILNKTNQIKLYRDKPESEIPHCTDAELWRADPVFKYFGDPAKANDPAARSTKNFSTLAEANKHCAEKGKGVVITKLGEPKRCAYCRAFEACSQKDQYL